MLQYVPIVTYSCNLFYSKKKKKKDSYFSMSKNTKVMPQHPAIYLFSWEREGILTSQDLTEKKKKKKKKKKLSKSALSALPQHAKHSDSDNVWMMHAKIAQNKFIFFCKFCTFPVTEGYAIWHSISSSQPRQESSPTEQNLSMSG